MEAHDCTSSDPMYRRFWAYLLERFPPVAYTLLVALFGGSALALIERSSGVRVDWSVALRACLVVWLAFFRLRIMDEHKDAAGDCVAYPDRLLTRGVVTLPMLAHAGLGAVLVQAVLAASISMQAFWTWLTALLFTCLMKVEFGIGEWLNQHLVVYAITHNPVVAFLAVFLWGTTGAPWSVDYSLYIALVSLGSLAFEIGRKIRRPEEELAGVDSYSSILGRARADHLLILTRWAASCVLVALAFRAQHWPIAGLALLFAVVAHSLLVRHTLQSKAVEGVATSMLLLDFVLVWGLGW